MLGLLPQHRVFVFQCMDSFQVYRSPHVFGMSLPSGRTCTVMLRGVYVVIGAWVSAWTSVLQC